MQLLTDKYKPTLEHIPQDMKPVVEYVTSYTKQKKKSLLIYGPTGTGKTAAVYALAEKLGVELVEVNASDFRSADEINAKIGNALKQQSLFSKSKLILIDELDGISGNEDRGGVSALTDLIANAKFPVILIANDPFESKFNPLRTKSVLLEFPAIPVAAMVSALKRIVEGEKITVDDSFLKSLARRSGGDLRGAIIDLQTLLPAPSMKDLDTLHERQHAESIRQVLVKIFKSTDEHLARTAFDVVDEDLNECMLWIDENLPKEYKAPADIARAYNWLSKADVFQGRIRRWQHWRFLVYVSALMSAGVALAKDKKSPDFVQYERTQRILKLWMAKQKYARRTRVGEKVGAAPHTSKKKAVHDSVPFIYALYQKRHPSTALISSQLKFDEEELEWLEK